MTENPGDPNPFGEGEANPFGGGGLDLGAIMQQAQQMQEQLLAAQDQLARSTVEGAAGGLVTVTLSGTGELQAVNVKAGSFDPDDADSLTDLGDLIVAAYRDGKARADALAAETMGPLAGGPMGQAFGDEGPGGALPGGGGPVGFGV